MALLDKAYIHAAVRSILQEPTAAFWTNEQIDNWINEAAMDISTKTGCYEQTHSFSTVANTLEYSEPTGCIKVHSCTKGGYEWVQHLDDDDWDCLHPAVPDWGLWVVDHWTARIASETTFALVPAGTWAAAYRPTHLRGTFTTEGTAPTLVLYDTENAKLVEEADYVSGTSVTITWGEYDIGQIRFALVSMNEDVSVTNIEFFSPSTEEHKGLARIHPRLIGRTVNETGPPENYYHHHSKIGIWPLADAGYPSTAYYSKVTDDITKLRPEMRLLAIPYCVANARLCEGWENDFKMFMTMYLSSLMAYRQERGQNKLNAMDAKGDLQIPDERD